MIWMNEVMEFCTVRERTSRRRALYSCDDLFVSSDNVADHLTFTHQNALN